VLRPELVRRKLQLIAEDLERLVPFRDESYESLIGDPLRLAAVERILERIVMRAIDTNEHIISELATGAEERVTRLSYRETFLRLAELGVYSPEFAQRIARSAGLRNILVHDYNDVDHRVLFESIPSALQEYQEYVQALDAFLARRGDGSP